MKTLVNREELLKHGIDPKSYAIGFNLGLRLGFSLNVKNQRQRCQESQPPRQKRGAKPKIERDVAAVIVYDLLTGGRQLTKKAASSEVCRMFNLGGESEDDDARQIRRIREKSKARLDGDWHQFLLDGDDGSVAGILFESESQIQLDDAQNQLVVTGFGWKWEAGEKKASYSHWTMTSDLTEEVIRKFKTTLREQEASPPDNK